MYMYGLSTYIHWGVPEVWCNVLLEPSCLSLNKERTALP